MISRHSIWALVLSVALPATVAVRAGETTPEPTNSPDAPTITISARSDALFCDGLPRDQARRFAEDAQRVGAHLKAAQCFRIAGDFVRADGAQLRASAETGAASVQKIKANVETAKAQAKRIREAFRSR